MFLPLPLERFVVGINDLVRCHCPCSQVHEPAQSGGMAALYRGTLPKPREGTQAVIIRGIDVAEGNLRRLLRDLKLSLQVSRSYRHLCPMLGATVVEGQLAILMPVYDGSLYDLIALHHPNGLPRGLALHIVRQAAYALKGLHGRALLHHGIQPQNLLIRDGGREVAVADYGLSSLRQRQRKGGSAACRRLHRGFMAPEQYSVASFGFPGPKCDVWGLACTWLFLMTGQPPIGTNINGREVFYQLVHERRAPEVPDDLPDDFRLLLSDMLQIMPFDRPDIWTVIARLGQLLQVGRLLPTNRFVPVCSAIAAHNMIAYSFC